MTMYWLMGEIALPLCYYLIKIAVASLWIHLGTWFFFFVIPIVTPNYNLIITWIGQCVWFSFRCFTAGHFDNRKLLTVTTYWIPMNNFCGQFMTRFFSKCIITYLRWRICQNESLVLLIHATYSIFGVIAMVRSV